MSQKPSTSVNTNFHSKIRRSHSKATYPIAEPRAQQQVEPDKMMLWSLQWRNVARGKIGRRVVIVLAAVWCVGTYEEEEGVLGSTSSGNSAVRAVVVVEIPTTETKKRALPLGKCTSIVLIVHPRVWERSKITTQLIRLVIPQWIMPLHVSYDAPRVSTHAGDQVLAMMIRTDQSSFNRKRTSALYRTGLHETSMAQMLFSE